MRTIDLQSWSRREHFKFFNSFDHPHFSLCANVDITHFHAYTRQNNISFSTAFVYIITRTANSIPEFRYRIRQDSIIEHELVHPSYTILVKDDLFSFCTLDYEEKYLDFAARAAEKISLVKEHPTLTDPQGRDDLLFMTALPWVTFTSFMHPMNLQPADSIPRFAWGKYFEENGVIKIPLGVQAHHALMDGIHMGKYYTHIQEYLSHPADVLGHS